ncbi:MAG: serine/threonine protein kinase [Gemmatimonadetes bacterium]|nr:serine/threonine protein kinase [Gemmatimonadota bacterium]
MISSDSGERWARLEEMCVGALDLPPDERHEWLRKAADGDAALEAEARSLLAHHDPDFLATPVSTVRRLTEGETQPCPPGAPDEGSSAPVIQGYRLVRPLGRGGMGDVYLAVQEGDDYQRHVAVKVIRRGLDSEDVVSRFRRERKILSSLTHPNICALLDGGLTADGRPYFVMEYVDGVDLARWSEESGADTRERVELFLQVLGAVQHAHRTMVIHRDLKPSNILVAEGRNVKLLDFGIAKVLDEDESDGAFRTRAGRQALTPEYAAPEQLSDDLVTTASDIYSLGVVLHELITGHLPAAADTSPSLDRDLAIISTKALDPDPLQRYASASAVAEDLRRWLDGRPILARPSTFTYRARKFVRRRPWAAATAGAAAIALVALMALPWVARYQAEVERERALEVQGFLLEMFGATGGDRAVGDTLTARGLLDGQAELVDQAYADDPAVHVQMLRVLGEGYDRLGLPDEAEVHARNALALERQHGGLSADGLAASLNLLGWVRFQQGDPTEARAHLEEAVSHRRDLGRRYRSELARSLNDLAVVLDAEGDYERSAGFHAEAFQVRMEDEGLASRATAVSASNLAVAHYRQGDFASAEEFGAIAVESLRRSLGADHQRTIIAQNNLAAFRIAGGNLEGARDTYVDLIERQTRLQGRDHPVTTGLMGSLATVEILRGAGEPAEALAREILSIEADRWGSDSPRSGGTLRLLGRALVLRGEFEAGVAALTTARGRLETLLGPEHREVAATVAAIAEAYERAGQPENALAWQERAVNSYIESYGPDHPETGRHRERLDSLRSSQRGSTRS